MQDESCHEAQTLDNSETAEADVHSPDQDELTWMASQPIMVEGLTLRNSPSSASDIGSIEADGRNHTGARMDHNDIPESVTPSTPITLRVWTSTTEIVGHVFHFLNWG